MLPDAHVLAAWLARWQFWWLELLFLAFALTTLRALPSMLRAMRAGAAWWTLVLLISGGGLAAAYVLPPVTNRIFYDEQIYQHVGQNMADLHRTQMCAHGIVEYGQLQCLASEYNKEPYGYPYLLSLGYRIAGTSDAFAHHLNRWLHALCALTVGILALRLTGSRTAGVMAALTMTLLPEQLRWSATAAAEPSASLFVAIAVLAAVGHVQAPSGRALAWMVAATAWAIQFRPESGLVVGVIAAFVLLHAPGLVKERRTWIALICGAVVVAAYGLHLAAVRNDTWGAGAAPFAPSHVWSNLPVNGWFYFADSRFPAWVGVTAVLGLVIGTRAPARTRLSLAFYFLAFWGIFLFFYAGSYNYGADVRYSLVSYVPLVLLSSIGVASLLARVPARHVALARAAVAGLALWTFALQAPYIRSIGEEAWAARADAAYAREIAATLEPDALVLTHNPNMFLLWGVNAAQMFVASNQGFLARELPRHGRNIYVHWGFWCNVVDPVQQALCDGTLASMPTELAHERTERNYRFAFYRVTAEP